MHMMKWEQRLRGNPDRKQDSKILLVGNSGCQTPIQEGTEVAMAGLMIKAECGALPVKAAGHTESRIGMSKEAKGDTKT